MKVKTLLTRGALVLSIIFFMGSTSAFAQLTLVERSTKTEGATTITWDSSFEVLNYVVGNEITMVVNWDVVKGFAMFNGFTLRGPRFTPKGPDPAKGTFGKTELLGDSGAAGTSGSVEVTFKFTELHCDEERQVEIGNAHFWLLLDVDTTGDGADDSVVGYGVNVHVEQPGACVALKGGPPAGAGPPRGRP